MELSKLKADEIRSWDLSKRVETAREIRSEMLKTRMDIYSAKAQTSGKVKGLKKSLARLLTVQSEQNKSK